MDGELEIRFCDEVFLREHAEEFAVLCREAFCSLLRENIRVADGFITADEMCARVRGKELLGAYLGTKLCGFLIFTELTKVKIKGGHIDLVAVSPACQGRGIGKSLLETAENYLRERGIGNVTVCTPEVAAKNVRWYCRLGYEPLWLGRGSGNYRSIGFYKALFPDLKMRKWRVKKSFWVSSFVCRLRLRRDGSERLPGKILKILLRK